MTKEQLITWIGEQNISEVSRATGIPNARMYKWVSGDGAPKTDDYNKLIAFYNKNRTSSEKIQELADATGEPHTDKDSGSLLNYLLRDKIESMEKENKAIRERLEEVERILNEKQKNKK